MIVDNLRCELDAAGVLTLTFDAPAIKNALDTRGQRRLVELLRDAARNPAVRVVVLTGAGEAFCTGADVRSMGAPDPDDTLAQAQGNTPAWQSTEARIDRLRHFARAAEYLHRMGKPTIARLRGPAAGLGFSLALACDIRIADDSAALYPAFVRIGTSGDYGGTYFLARLVGPARATEILMLGLKIDASEGLRLGLLNRVVPAADLDAATQALAQQLAAGPPIALRYIKENVAAAGQLDLPAFLDVESAHMIRCRLTDDCKEAMAAFLGKRPAVFKGI